MNRHSHFSRESSTRAGNPAPRWRNVILALVLVLTLGSVSQTHPVQAAPAGELVTYHMYVTSPKTRICVGKTVEFRAKVFSVSAITPLLPTPNIPVELALSGVKIEAFSSDKSVGNFKKNTAITGFANLDLITAEFSFTGKKPGKTNRYFEGLIDKKDKGSYVSFTVPVKVISCKVKVRTVLQVQAAAFDATGISDDAVMTADEAGTFTGSTSMHWVFSNYSKLFELPGCTFSMSAADSQVDLTGKLDEDGGQFVATETIQPTMTSDTWACPGIAPGGDEGIATMAPLTFRVASSGGVSTQTGVVAQWGFGSVRIVMVPEEDEAAAFIPGDHEAGAGPPSLRWAMLWDDFSSFFGALLALH